MGKDLSQAGFDYTDLAKDLKGKLISLAGSIKKAGLSHIEHAIQMGQELTVANELLAKASKESLFGSWVKAECGISRQTAYNYMNAYERFGESCCQSLGQLTAEAMYLLAGDSVPEEAVETAINLANKGTRITKDVALELKRRFKDEEYVEPRGAGSEVQGGPSEPHDESPEPGPVDQGQVPSEASPEPLAEGPLCDDFYAATQACGALIRLIDQLKVKGGPSKHHEDCINSIDICHMALKAWRKEKHAWREKVA